MLFGWWSTGLAAGGKENGSQEADTERPTVANQLVHGLDWIKLGVNGCFHFVLMMQHSRTEAVVGTTLGRPGKRPGETPGGGILVVIGGATPLPAG